MPVPNVAANPIASISPPAAPASGAATAAEGQVNTPFAATLKKQMTDQQPTAPGTTAENKEAKTAAQDASQAALLPMLLGSAELADWVAANLAQNSAAKAPDAETETETPSAPTDPVLGLLAVPIAAATNPVVDAAVQTRPDGNAARDAATVIDRLLSRLLPAAKAEGSTADTETSTADPDSFLAVAEARTKTDKGTINTPVIAASTDSPAIVAASAETIAAAAKSDAGPRGDFGSVPTINRDPGMATAVAAMTQASPGSQAANGIQRIDTPVGAAGWHNEVGNHVAWMANHQQGRAELVLTPPQFGRIEISLSVTGDQANAYFVSANPAVRETLESALPRLREILADAGINLGQAQVGSESPGQSADKRENGDNSWRGLAAVSVGDGVASARVGAHAVNPWSASGRGMVDTFA